MTETTVGPDASTAPVIRADQRWFDRSWFPAAIAGVLALLLFSVTLHGTYVYDDQQIILRDKRVIDPSHFREIWTKDYFNGGIDNLYRPLVTLSYFAQWQLHGDMPWAFHLVNWLLHAGASALAAELARRLAKGNARVAIVAGCLFAVHPVHVEVVANIVGRAESMCAIAMLAAMVLFLARPMTVSRALVIGAFATIAALSKEQGLLLPLLFIPLYIVRKQIFPVAPDAKERNALLTLVVALCWPVAVIVFLRENVLGLKFWWDPYFLDYTQNPITQSHGRDRLLMPISLLGRYMRLLVFPTRLSPDYGGITIGSVAKLRDPYLWAGVSTIVIYTIALLVAALKRRWVIVFCLFSLGVLYGLIGNTVSIIGTIFGERLLFLPSAFALILIAILLARVQFRVLMPIVIMLVVLASVRSFTYARLWNDPIAFYTASIRQNPGSIRLYFVLSEELQRQGQLDEAAEVLAVSRGVMPEYAGVWYRSALMALRRGKFEEAAVYARKAGWLDPRMMSAKVWDMINARQIMTDADLE